MQNFLQVRKFYFEDPQLDGGITVRLNIKKATLRHWRSQFASHLRGLGVAANATERAVRGESRSAKKDGIYRASLRGESTYMRPYTEAAAKDLESSKNESREAKAQIESTRTSVLRGWGAVAKQILDNGDRMLAAQVVDFVRGMAPPTSDREITARAVQDNAKKRSRVVQSPTR